MRDASEPKTSKPNIESFLRDLDEGKAGGPSAKRKNKRKKRRVGPAVQAHPEERDDADHRGGIFRCADDGESEAEHRGLTSAASEQMVVVDDDADDDDHEQPLCDLFKPLSNPQDFFPLKDKVPRDFRLGLALILLKDSSGDRYENLVRIIKELSFGVGSWTLDHEIRKAQPDEVEQLFLYYEERTVKPGDIVTLRNTKTNKEVIRHIVSDDDPVDEPNKIFMSSPLAKELIAKGKPVVKESGVKEPGVKEPRKVKLATPGYEDYDEIAEVWPSWSAFQEGVLGRPYLDMIFEDGRLLSKLDETDEDEKLDEADEDEKLDEADEDEKLDEADEDEKLDEADEDKKLDEADKEKLVHFAETGKFIQDDSCSEILNDVFAQLQVANFEEFTDAKNMENRSVLLQVVSDRLPALVTDLNKFHQRKRDQGEELRAQAEVVYKRNHEALLSQHKKSSLAAVEKALDENPTLTKVSSEARGIQATYFQQFPSDQMDVAAAKEEAVAMQTEDAAGVKKLQLSSMSIELREDGGINTVAVVKTPQPEHKPTKKVEIILDCSGSMRGLPWELQCEAAVKYIEDLRRDTNEITLVSVSVFDTKITTLCSFMNVSDIFFENKNIMKVLNENNKGGRTNYKPILTMLKERKEEGILSVVFSDGVPLDFTSVEAFAAQSEELKKKGISIIGVFVCGCGCGWVRDSRFLKVLSGGERMVPCVTPDRLSDIFEVIKGIDHRRDGYDIFTIEGGEEVPYKQGVMRQPSPETTFKVNHSSAKFRKENFFPEGYRFVRRSSDKSKIEACDLGVLDLASANPALRQATEDFLEGKKRVRDNYLEKHEETKHNLFKYPCNFYVIDFRAGDQGDDDQLGGMWMDPNLDVVEDPVYRHIDGLQFPRNYDEPDEPDGDATYRSLACAGAADEDAMLREGLGPVPRGLASADDDEGMMRSAQVGHYQHLHHHSLWNTGHLCPVAACGDPDPDSGDEQESDSFSAAWNKGVKAFGY